MRYLILFLLITASTVLAAQPMVRNKNDIYDSCPDPAKHRIASRTIYKTCSDSVTTGAVDTCMEQYDRKGNLVLLKYFEPGAQWSKGHYIIAYHFSYNNDAALVCDSSIYDDTMLYITKYVYNRTERTVIAHIDRAGKIATVFMRYDSSNTITSRDHTDARGDTLQRMYTKANSTFSIYYERNSDGDLLLTDTITETRTRSQKTIISIFPGAPFYDGLRSVETFDSTGKRTDKMLYVKVNQLQDSIHYFYNSKAQITGTYSLYYPRMNITDTIIRHEERLYDLNGRLLQTKAWIEKEPDVIYCTHYTYNEKGLLIEKTDTTQRGTAPAKTDRCERWVYTYY